MNTCESQFLIGFKNFAYTKHFNRQSFAKYACRAIYQTPEKRQLGVLWNVIISGVKQKTMSCFCSKNTLLMLWLANRCRWDHNNSNWCLLLPRAKYCLLIGWCDPWKQIKYQLFCSCWIGYCELFSGRLFVAYVIRTIFTVKNLLCPKKLYSKASLYRGEEA